MKRKALLALFTVALMVTLSACVGGGQKKPTATLTYPETSNVSGESGKEVSAAAGKVKMDECENNLDGLCKYLEGNYAVTGQKELMSYAVIDATNGYKYTFSYEGKNVQVELYEFDLDNLTDNAKKALKRVKEEGVMPVLENEVSALLSDNGKYVMFYIDNSTEEVMKAQRERAITLFKEFYA